MSALRRWRLRRLTDQRDDLVHQYAEWGWASSWTPSRTRKHHERVERLTAKIKRLSVAGGDEG